MHRNKIQYSSSQLFGKVNMFSDGAFKAFPVIDKKCFFHGCSGFRVEENCEGKDGRTDRKVSWF